MVLAEGATSRLDIADPQAMLDIVGNEQIGAVAEEAKQRLQRIIAVLSGQNEAGQVATDCWYREGGITSAPAE